jgi:hypothetical protein
MSCPSEDVLLRSAEEEAPEARTHLKDCSACRDIVGELQGTIAELRAAAPPVAPPSGERLLRLTPSPSTALPRRIFVAAAAMLLAATAFALFPPKPKPARPSERASTPPPKAAPEPKPAPARRQDPSERDDWIAGGLGWLSRNQKPDGSIGNTGLTGLSLLAFFGAGHGETSALYGRTVQSALAYLMAVQGQDGRFGQPDEARLMYGDAIATWALVEAVGGGRSLDPRVKLSGQQAVSYLIAAQNPGMGWRYSSKCGDNDSSVTFWAAGALASAKLAGFDVPAEVFDGARAWIRSVTDEKTLSVGYTAPRTGKVYVPGINEEYRHHETMSAAAMALRLLLGDARDEAMAAAVGMLAVDPPGATPVTDIDFYYWHLGTLSLYLHDGAGTATWMDWQGRLLEGLKPGRAADGSWEPNDRWAGVNPGNTGRAYATALNVLTLEVPSRPRR